MRTRAERDELRAGLMICHQCGNTRRRTKDFSVCPGLMHNYDHIQPPVPCLPRPPRSDIDREQLSARFWAALDLLDAYELGNPEPAPVVEPSQGAEEAWQAFAKRTESDHGPGWLIGAIWKAGYVAAKAEQAALSEALRLVAGMPPLSSLAPSEIGRRKANYEAATNHCWIGDGYPGPEFAEAAPSEPLSPTTEELRETVALAIGASGYVVEQLAHEALSELARRVKA